MKGETRNNEKKRADQLIEKKGLRIRKLFFDKGSDLILLLLNDRNIIERRLSDFYLLKDAPEEHLKDYRLSPFGVHWPALDEDINLKGLLEEEDLKSFGRE